MLYRSAGGHEWGVRFIHCRLGYQPQPRLWLPSSPKSWNINCTLIIFWGSVLSVFMFHIHQQGQWSDPRQLKVIPSRPLTLIHPPCPPPTPDTHKHTHTYATVLLVVTPANSLSILLSLLVICFSIVFSLWLIQTFFLHSLSKRSPASGPCPFPFRLHDSKFNS